MCFYSVILGALFLPPQVLAQTDSTDSSMWNDIMGYLQKIYGMESNLSSLFPDIFNFQMGGAVVGSPCTSGRQCSTGVCDLYCPAYDFVSDTCEKKCATCVDTDPTDDPHVRGRVSNPKLREYRRDYCTADNSGVVEVRCDLKGSFIEKTVVCPTGEQCQGRGYVAGSNEGPQEAACIPIPTAPSVTCYNCVNSACAAITLEGSSCGSFLQPDLASCQSRCGTPTVTCYNCGAANTCAPVTIPAADCGFLPSDMASCQGMCSQPPSGSVPPTDNDRTLCSQPDPSRLPAGTLYRHYDDANHVSWCETESSVRYVVCSPDGTVRTVNVTPCPNGMPCVNGTCADSWIRQPTCTETGETGRDPK